MDASTIEACFEEISNTVLDLDRKVKISQISNNWSASFKDSENLLSKWLEKQGDKKFAKEFLIRGTHNDGHCILTVVPENRLKAIENQCMKFTKTLYSIECPSLSTNSLDIDELTKCNHINLILNNGHREIQIRQIPQIEPKKQPETGATKKSFFGNVPKKVEPKTEPVNVFKSPPKSVPNKVEPQNVEKSPNEHAVVKKEIKTPIKETPKKKETNVKSVAAGRSAISSFFSKAPNTPKPVKPEPKDESPKNDQQNTCKNNPIENVAMEKVSSNENHTNSQKRSYQTICDPESDSDDVIPVTPDNKPVRQSKKKAKINVTPASKASRKKSTEKKRARIVKATPSKSSDDNSDVDDDDDDEKQNNLPKSPGTLKENKTPPTDLSTTADGEKPVNGSKSKRKVNRVYQKDDGYFVTVKEIEEYSCSDEEMDVTETAPTTTCAAEVNKSNEKNVNAKKIISPTPEKATKKNKKTPPQAISKKGTILNFFTKK